MFSRKPPKLVEILLKTRSLDSLNDIHQQHVDLLHKQKMAPKPLILDQKFDSMLTYADVPIVVPRAMTINADVQREAQVRFLLTNVNTITEASSELIHENPSNQGATQEELQAVQ